MINHFESKRKSNIFLSSFKILNDNNKLNLNQSSIISPSNFNIIEFDENIIDEMRGFVFDCLSTLTVLKVDLNKNVNKTKDNIFWESIKCICENNLILLNDKVDDKLDKKKESFEFNNATNYIIHYNFPRIKPIEEGYNVWFELKWFVSINSNFISFIDYCIYLKKNSLIISNDISTSTSIHSLNFGHLLVLKNRFDMNEISFIFDNIPLVAFQKDKNNYCCLHYAAKCCKDKCLIEYIIKQNPNALLNDDNDIGYIPLFMSLDNNEEIFITLMNASKSSLNYISRNGMNIIHKFLLCFWDKSFTFSYDILSFIIENNPNILCLRDGNQCYPIHYACACYKFKTSNNLDMIDMILEKSSYQFLSSKDNDDFIPLVYTIKTCNYKLFKLIYDLYPEGIKIMFHNNSDSFFTLLFKNCKDISFIKLICNEFQELVIKDYDNNSNYLLHNVFLNVFNNNIPYELIKYLVEYFPEAIMKRNNNNILPIQNLHKNYFEHFNEPNKYVMREKLFKIINLITNDNVSILECFVLDNNDNDNVNETLYNSWSEHDNIMHRFLSYICCNEALHNQDFRDLNFSKCKIIIIFQLI